MISNRFKCVFFHQRKNAGSSIIRSFGYTPGDQQWHLFNDGTLSPEWRKHRQKLKGNYVIFTVVRNPWDRFVSGWKYLPKYRDMTFDQLISNLPKEGHDYRHLTRPQLDILVDDNGEFVPDVVLRYESLESDFRGFCESIGKEFCLPTINVTRHSSFKEFKSKEQIEFVGNLFRDDITYFSYSFPGILQP